MPLKWKQQLQGQCSPVNVSLLTPTDTAASNTAPGSSISGQCTYIWTLGCSRGLLRFPLKTLWNTELEKLFCSTTSAAKQDHASHRSTFIKDSHLALSKINDTSICDISSVTSPRKGGSTPSPGSPVLGSTTLHGMKFFLVLRCSLCFGLWPLLLVLSLGSTEGSGTTLWHPP